jgi:hypothetical protein
MIIILLSFLSGIQLYPGLCPEPHFILCLDTKNEARKIKPKRLLTRSAARQEFHAKLASLFAEIPCLAAFTATPAPRFGRADPRYFE